VKAAAGELKDGVRNSNANSNLCRHLAVNVQGFVEGIEREGRSGVGKLECEPFVIYGMARTFRCRRTKATAMASGRWNILAALEMPAIPAPNSALSFCAGAGAHARKVTTKGGGTRSVGWDLLRVLVQPCREI